MELHVCVLLFAMILYLYVLIKLVLNIYIYIKGGGVKMSQYIRWLSGLNILYGNKISEIEKQEID
jgi:hypothetical protein